MVIMAEKDPTFSTNIAQDEQDSFRDFVEDNGYMKKRAVLAALVLFQCAPPDLRELAMAGSRDLIEKWFKQHK